MRSPLDTSTLVLAGVAVVLAVIACPSGPGLPLMLAFVIPRMVVALARTPPGDPAGVVTPGGPMVTTP